MNSYAASSLQSNPAPSGYAESATFTGSHNRGVQIGQNTGTINHNSYAAATASQPDYAGRFSHSSLQPVKAFVARPLLRDQIWPRLCKDGDNRSTKILVVSGPGGFGKTQLILDYVQRYRTDYKATFWLEAERMESLERDFVNLWRALSGHTIISQEQIDVEGSIVGVKSWFSGREGPWLMVFDGADSIDNERASGYVDIKHYIPDAASLHVIITTRSGIARDMTRLEAIDVGEMTEAQAEELFYNYSELDRNDQAQRAEITAIVKELGYLALAVTLAATYVGRTPRLQSNISCYLPEYRQRRRELLSRKAESLLHGYSKSVLTTWEASYAAVEEQSAAAAAVMTLLSFLGFDDIYLRLFGFEEGDAEARNRSWLATVFGTEAADIYQIEESLEILQRYSLIQWKGGQESYAIHKLVHAWGYDRLSWAKQQEFSSAALTLVVGAVKSCGDWPEEKLRVVPHVMANFATVAKEKSGLDESRIDGMEVLGAFVAQIGRWAEARAIREYVSEARRQLLGETHLGTISAMNNLACTLTNQGHLEAAAEMMREVLEKREQILGDNHPDTISAMNNLANTLRDQGHLETAAKMKSEVLEKWRWTLGDDHPYTILAMNNLANTLGDQGHLETVVEMRREVLEKWRRILGDDHPDTISAMNNLANTLGDQGHLETVAEMRREVLEKWRRTLGDDHPYTISAMNNLAITLGDQGHLEAAAEMKREVLEKRKRILGDDHLDTISAMSNLAITLGDQGHPEAAAGMKREVLEKWRRTLGNDHPHTISAMSNLANTLVDQGQLEAAAEMRREVLEKRKRILGDDHPDTISAMSNLANTLVDQDQLEAAAEMRREVLEKRRRILGDDHLDTILAMNNLAITLRDQGQLEIAAKIGREVLEKRKRILGDDHPDTISAMNNLAIMLRDQGHPEAAAEMIREVLEKRKQILGDDHPDTITAMNNLAASVGGQGQLDEAIALLEVVVPRLRQLHGDNHPYTRRAMNNLKILIDRRSNRDAVASQD